MSTSDTTEAPASREWPSSGATRTAAPKSSPGHPSSVAGAFSTLGLAIKKPFLSATTLLSDSGLRKKSAAMLSQQTNVIISPLKAGLTTLFDGPRQVQSTLTRLQKEYSQKRIDLLLEKHRDEHQDVQIGFLLYEDAPQELRSRLWMAVLGAAGGELMRAYANARNDMGGEVDDAGKERGRHGGEGGEGGSDLPTSPNPPPRSIQEVYAETKDQSMMLPWNKKKEGYRNTLMKAMVDVEWPPGGTEGDEVAGGADSGRRDEASAKFPEIAASSVSDPASASGSASRSASAAYQHDYRTLLQISVGQEDVDDIISRDIHRTFPEHPLFGFKQGQESLFNLLKAYSLHDLEVGYCQGMAFVAGILLMYVPEERAFTIFCRLMEGLRDMYLPEMLGLKLMLGSFDELMQRYLPALKDHLEAHGVASVLYCTQWFLSMYACPFPVIFSARIIDVMLLQGEGQGILLRTALAIMCESEAELLALNDFEALLMHLKVDPLTWNTTRLRRVLNAAFSSPISDVEVTEVASLVGVRLSKSEDDALDVGTDGRGGDGDGDEGEEGSPTSGRNPFTGSYM